MHLKCLLLPLCIYVSLLSFSQNEPDSLSAKNNEPVKHSAKQEKKAKNLELMNLTPDSGKALVYIVRPSIIGFAVPMRIDCDSFQIGWISAKTFLYTMLDPGDHTFISLAENETRLKEHFESGKVYYIEQEVRMGMLYARSKLRLIHEELAKEELSKCTISGSNHYPKLPLSRDVEKSPPKN